MIPTATQPIRIYADTSVYGGVFDEEFAEPSRAFFDRVREGRFRLVVSALVEDELAQSPLEVRDWFGQFRARADSVAVTGEAVALRQAYLDAGIVTPNAIDDALHVALATVARCDIIVSWNFRHIVHFEKMRGFNAVNLREGYRTIEIHSPKEVV